LNDKPKNINTYQDNNRRGVALLVVLFIVATISILSLGFAIKADTELSCGRNVELRMDMDYLGLTSLNYAKSLVLNPQDVTTGADGYWQGDTDLQIEASEDYYDIQVVRSLKGDTPECTYDISSQSYRLEDGIRISETKLQGQLRLDPFIAFYSVDSTFIPTRFTVYGDVYCGGDLWVYGKVKGDMFANSFTDNFAEIDGQFYEQSKANVSWPDIYYWRFEPSYYIDTVRYWPALLGGTYSDRIWGPTAGNPAGIYYRDGNLRIEGNVKINGTLVVNGDLDIVNGSLEITAMKNYPALIVEKKTKMDNSGSLKATGLVQTYEMEIKNDASNLIVTGGLYIFKNGLNVEGGYPGSITVRGDPMKASIKLMSTAVNMMEWSPVGGAYFKSIKRDN